MHGTKLTLTKIPDNLQYYKKDSIKKNQICDIIVWLRKNNYIMEILSNLQKFSLHITVGEDAQLQKITKMDINQKLLNLFSSSYRLAWEKNHLMVRVFLRL
jgi:hypothetical protein